MTGCATKMAPDDIGVWGSKGQIFSLTKKQKRKDGGGTLQALVAVDDHTQERDNEWFGQLVC